MGRINGYSKLAFTILYSLGFIAVIIVGILHESEVFTMVWSGMLVVLMIMVRDLYKDVKLNGLK